MDIHAWTCYGFSFQGLVMLLCCKGSSRVLLLEITFDAYLAHFFSDRNCLKRMEIFNLRTGPKVPMSRGTRQRTLNQVLGPICQEI